MALSREASAGRRRRRWSLIAVDATGSACNPCTDRRAGVTATALHPIRVRGSRSRLWIRAALMLPSPAGRRERAAPVEATGSPEVPFYFRSCGIPPRAPSHVHPVLRTSFPTGGSDRGTGPRAWHQPRGGALRHLRCVRPTQCSAPRQSIRFAGENATALELAVAAGNPARRIGIQRSVCTFPERCPSG